MKKSYKKPLIDVNKSTLMISILGISGNVDENTEIGGNDTPVSGEGAPDPGINMTSLWDEDED